MCNLVKNQSPSTHKKTPNSLITKVFEALVRETGLELPGIEKQSKTM